MRNMKRFMAFALAVMMFMSNTVSVSATGSTAPASMSGQNVITGTSEPGAVVPSSVEESTPEESTPEASMPEESTPEASTPEVSTPEASTPEESTSAVATTEEATTEEATTEEATTEEATTEEATTEEVTTEEATTEEMPTADALYDTTSSPSLIVTHGGVTRSYVNTEEAIKKMAADFKSEKGDYTFRYQAQDSLTANVTIPAFVTELTLEKDGTTDVGLILNGKTLTTTASISLMKDWNLGTKGVLKANALYVPGGKSLTADQIILNNDKTSVYGKITAKNVTLNKARVEIVSYGRLVTENMTVNSAYPGDSMGDDTLFSENELLIQDTLTMKDGTFCNEGMAEIGNAKIKDMINRPEAQLLCDTFSNTGKLTLERDSILLINETGTINNVVLGKVSASQNSAALGKGSAAKVSVNGTFTTMQENTRLQAFVTDSYRDVIGLAETDPFEKVLLEGDDGYAEKPLTVLGADALLFSTTNSNFPVDSIFVLPGNIPSTETETATKNNNCSVYQSGNQLLVAGDSIHVYINNLGTESLLKNFSNYKDAVTYINALNNMSASYVIEFDTNTDAMGTLSLPAKATDITLRAANPDTQIVLSYLKDIALATDTTFENIAFMPYKDVKTKGVYAGTMDTKGKKLVLSNACVCKYTETLPESFFSIRDAFNTIKGGNTTSVSLTDASYIMVSNKITGINDLSIEGGSYLEVKAGGLFVNNLYVEKGSSDAESQIIVDDGKSIIEVKNCLKMDYSTRIYSAGTIKLKDVVSNCEGNLLATKSANSITISGKVTSDDLSTTSYVEETDEGTLLGYRKETNTDHLNENWNQPLKEGIITTDRMKNAIRIHYDADGASTFKLVNAKLVSPTWFITNIGVSDVTAYTNMTQKEGDFILVGENEQTNIELSLKIGSKESIINRFETLQDAFFEIDRLGDSDAEYIVKIVKEGENVLNSDTYKIATTAVKNGKLAEFTFPSKAKEVTIYAEQPSESDDYQRIFYSQNMKLNCNVIFDGVLPMPTKAGNITIGGYSLTMSNVANLGEDNFLFGITGSGTNKGSRFVVTDSGLGLTKLDNVDTVKIVTTGTDSTYVCVTGETKIGDLDATEKTNYFWGLGKITMENIHAPQNDEDGLIIGSQPKLTEKNGVFTKSEAMLNISGKATGNIGICLLDKNGDEIKLAEDEEKYADLITGKTGLIFAKAPNASVNEDEFLLLNGTEDGVIYKQSGNLVYKETKPQVTLSYEIKTDGESASSTEVTEYYETYADAIAQINVLKTKRDYKIGFVSDDGMVNSEDNPVVLTAPKAECVDTLTLTSEGEEVFFKGDITFNSNIVLKNINFVQVVTQGNQNFWVSDYKVKKYVNPVNVKVNGAYTMRVVDDVKFNNAIALNGAKKATLVLDDSGFLYASFWGVSYSYYIEGSIKDFALVKAERNDIYICPYHTGAKTGNTYKAAELNVTNLSVSECGTVMVGYEDPLDKDSRSSGTMTVGDKLDINDSVLAVNGNATIKDVSLSNTADLAVMGNTFKITGTVISNTDEAMLFSALNTQNQSALTIEGDVVLTDPGNKIEVGNIDLLDYQGYDGYFGGTDLYYKKVSNKLLTAKKADVNAFAVYEDCLPSEHSEPYPGSGETPSGYILRKTGNDIMVHYAEDVATALYVGEGEEFYNYYASFNDAVAAIEALNAVNQSYAIEVLKDIPNGKVNLPKKAKNIRVYSDTDKEISYSDNLTLGCDTVLDGVKLSAGKGKVINVNGYHLTLDALASDEIGSIKGNKKGTVTVLPSKDLTISGFVTDLSQVEILCEEVSHKVMITGDLKADELKQYTNSELITKGKAVITDYTMDKVHTTDQTKWTYQDLTIQGEIYSENGAKAFFTKDTTVTPANKSANKVTLSNPSKLLTVKKADLSDVTFMQGETSVSYALWANGAVYMVEADAAKNAVLVGIGRDASVNCLDLAQASSYVNTRAEKETEYTFTLAQDISDTCVTDGNPTGKLTLPSKDRMAKLTVHTGISSGRTLEFTGDIAVNGYVEFVNISLSNAKDFSIQCASNSATTEESINGVSLNKITINGAGKINTITGDQKNTVIALNNSKLNMKGGITKVATLKLNQSKLTTQKESKVERVEFEGTVINECIALAKATIGSVSGKGVLGTILNAKDVPQMTIMGDVSEPIIIGLYDSVSGKRIESSYDNKALVIAKTAPADCIMASGCLKETMDGLKEGYVAYKDANNYVYNGNLSEMEVLLTDITNGGNATTYAKTYADAITVINNMNNAEGEYKITLLAPAGSTSHVIKTGLNNYGKFTLPQAGKAKSLAITSKDTAKPVTIKYTDTLKISGKLKLSLDNVILTEGKTGKEAGSFTESNSITLDIGDGEVFLGKGVKTPHTPEDIKGCVPDCDQDLYHIDSTESSMDTNCTIVFNKITAKSGTLHMDSSIVFVKGEVSLAHLQGSNETGMDVYAKGNIKINRVSGYDALNLLTTSSITLGNLEDANVSLCTTFTKKEWKKATAQVSVTGEADNHSGLGMVLYCYGTDGKCRKLNSDELQSLLWKDMSKKPEGYQKLMSATKLSNASIRVLYSGAGDDPRFAAYNGGIYMTTQIPLLSVEGSYDDAYYNADFYSWEQAVSAIDNLNHPDWAYTIILLETIGDDETPVKNLNLPSKAKAVTIVATNSNDGIITTGSSVNLKSELTMQAPIASVKKSGNRYYSNAYTVNTGKYALHIALDSTKVKQYSPLIKLSGAATGEADITVSQDTDMITQISNIGTVTFNHTFKSGLVNCSVKEGIKGVTNLLINEGITVESDKDVTTKNLSISGTSGESLDRRGTLLAKNVTVSNTLTMGSACVKAGTGSSGDGKLILNQIELVDNHNILEAKQDKNGRSQIQIKGTVEGVADSAYNPEKPGITVGLYYANSTTRYASLYNDMMLLQAPKAANSCFVPYYATLEDRNEHKTPNDPGDDTIVTYNMGREQGAMVTKRLENGNLEASKWVATYGLVKSGNDIVYRKIYETDAFEHYGNTYTEIKDSLCEVKVRIKGQKEEMAFATYEEAVKAIDSMGLKEADGKTFTSFTIEMLRNVEIGNENGNHKYGSLPFPSKASEVTIDANSKYAFIYTGNITPRCNTNFSYVTFIPVKTVKNEVVAGNTDLVIGNNTVQWIAAVFDCDTETEGIIGKVTGSAKGNLIVQEYYLVTNSISGVGMLTLQNAVAYILGNATVGGLHFENGEVRVEGTLTTNAIYQMDRSEANILHFEDKPIAVKGITRTVTDEAGKNTKVKDSVLSIDEDGTVLEVTPDIVVITCTKDANDALQTGTKLVTGNDLDPDDWTFMDKDANLYTHYKSGNALCLGRMK